ncbi:hypothetical protein [Nostoc commune]|uniref:hypothetical protein n=1 Tax=Nostoc commune TaxID=1178 RepID=UPI0020737BDA|nr:hypothetical protein [Nostoc commune]
MQNILHLKLYRRSHFGETSGAIGILRTTFRKGDRSYSISPNARLFQSHSAIASQQNMHHH